MDLDGEEDLENILEELDGVEENGDAEEDGGEAEDGEELEEYPSLKEWMRDKQKPAEIIRSYLGVKKPAEVSASLPAYYSRLLAWALKHYMKDEGWKVAKTFDSRGGVLRYTAAQTGMNSYENVYRKGYFLLKRQERRLAVFLDNRFDYQGEAWITAYAVGKREASRFAGGVAAYAEKNNFYRGGKLDFSGLPFFIKLPERCWQDIAIDPAMRDEVEANTTSFLSRIEDLAEYGVPGKRGVLLVGEPGTGKSLLCRVLMNESPGITCILASDFWLFADGYLDSLYRMANDLKPSIVIIEDIDLIGDKRRGKTLYTLLKMLDGIEQFDGVVTVATTNFLESLDKALTERPSRFDRIIRLQQPGERERMAIIRRLARRIPLDDQMQEYIAGRTAGYTPAQVQEAVFSIVIDHRHTDRCGNGGRCMYGKEEVDAALAKVRQPTKPIGFVPKMDRTLSQVAGILNARDSNNNGNKYITEEMKG